MSLAAIPAIPLTVFCCVFDGTPGIAPPVDGIIVLPLCDCSTSAGPSISTGRIPALPKRDVAPRAFAVFAEFGALVRRDPPYREFPLLCTTELALFLDA